ASAALRVGLFTLLPLSRAEKRTYTMRLFMGLDTHADTLLLGCLAGLVVAWGVFPQTAGWRRGLHVAGWLSLAGLATMLMRSHHEQYSYYYGLAVVLALMAAILLVWWMVAPPCILKFFELSPLVGLGRISYALYLFHMPLVQFCRPMRASWGVAKTSLVVISVSLLLAILSYYLIERPVLSLRHRRQGLRPVADDVPARAA
ncbi:MAG: acyltransferase family protein, partial [Gemmataceae bacterium]|nr:acyltransferase family protein [Gemmataceae bacterium]MDW8266664.1 acyltransferase family protein [Gemmataceae bacterium]